MRNSLRTLLPLSVLGLGAAALLAAPACTDGLDSTPIGDELTRSIEELNIDMCGEEFLELDLSGEYHVICGLVVDTEGKLIEVEGVEIRIDGKVVSKDPKVLFTRLRDKDNPGVRIDISAPGYAPYISTTTGSLINQPFVLQPLNISELNWEEGGKVIDKSSGSIVRVEPQSLVTATGKKPEGTISFGTFFFDPALQELPGDMTAVTAQGQMVYLQSNGTLFMAAVDEAGNELQLAPGAQVEVTMPLNEQLVEGSPESTQLWTFDRESGLWVQTKGEGQVISFNSAPGPQPQHPGAGGTIDAPNNAEQIIWNCSTFATNDPCLPEHCKFNSSAGTTGPFSSLGFVNFDIAKTDPGCVHIQIDVSAISPDDIPVCFSFTVQAPWGPVTRAECMGPLGTVLYNIPANSPVVGQLEYTDNAACPDPPGHLPFTVNSGAPWGGVGAPPDGSACNGSFLWTP